MKNNGETTMAQAMKAFLDSLLTEKGDSLKTKEAYETDLRQFSDWIGEISLNQLNFKILADYLRKLSKEGYKTTSLIRKEVSISNFFKFLIEENLADIRLAKIRFPKKERLLPEVLSQEEIRVLIDSLSTDTINELRFKAMLVLAYGSGLRVSELVNVKTTDIDLNERFVRVIGKGSRERIVPISLEASDCIRAWLSARTKTMVTRSKHLFVNRSGKPLTRQFFYEELKEAALKANINSNVSPHWLRHSFATHLLENGVPLSDVQALLGHARIETTQIYTHVSSVNARKAYDSIVGEGVSAFNNSTESSNQDKKDL